MLCVGSTVAMFSTLYHDGEACLAADVTRDMKTLLIVYHSQTGNTEKLARAASQGACQVPETYTRLIRAFDATLQDLVTCHGVLFGTPENLGYMSGAIKDFFDRTFYPAEFTVTRLVSYSVIGKRLARRRPSSTGLLFRDPGSSNCKLH